MAFLRDDNNDIKEAYTNLVTLKDSTFYTIIRDINKLKANKDSDGVKVSQQVLVSLYSFMSEADSYDSDGNREWNNAVIKKEIGFMLDQDSIAELETIEEESVIYPLVEAVYIARIAPTEG